LHRNGFQTMLLKGTALIFLYYQNYGLRSMSDVDILVPTKQVQDVLIFMKHQGWLPKPRHQATFTDEYVLISHGHEFYTHDQRSIDLHWHVLPECCQPDGDEDFWEAALPLDFLGVATYALCPADQLLHVCAHSARSCSAMPLRWVADVLTILHHGPCTLDWERLLEQAEKRRLSLSVRDTLTYVQQRYDAAVPQAVLDRLHQHPVSRLEKIEYHYKRQDHYHRLLGYLPIMWFDYSRLRGRISFVRKFLGFADYIRRFWGTGLLEGCLSYIFRLKNVTPQNSSNI
ncbi:nucleotidyltransferase family protein, partial [candidate division CSSED10-310 bacterium]